MSTHTQTRTQRPAWATAEYTDNGRVVYEREMEVGNKAGVNWPVALSRYDQDEPEILFGPNLDAFTLAEARRYALALLEQCDLAERS